MRNLFSSKKFRIFVLVVLSLFAAYLFLQGRLNKKEPVLPAFGVSYNSLTPGKSTVNDAIEKLGEPVSGSGSNRLVFRSTSPNRNHEITAENDKIVLIKEVVSVNDTKSSDQLKSAHGEALYILYGPRSGVGFYLYAYPEKGIAYLGHHLDSTLLEIWYFQPTTFEMFRSKWASNYSETLTPRE
jgi:hypothetical protein